MWSGLVSCYLYFFKTKTLHKILIVHICTSLSYVRHLIPDEQGKVGGIRESYKLKELRVYHFRRRFHGKESSPLEAIRELGWERLEAVCSLWIALNLTSRIISNKHIKSWINLEMIIRWIQDLCSLSLLYLLAPGGRYGRTLYGIGIQDLGTWL